MLSPYTLKLFHNKAKIKQIYKIKLNGKIKKLLFELYSLWTKG